MNPLEDLLEKIESHGLWEKQLTLSRNEYLKVKGSVETRLYLIASGSLRVFVTDEKEEHTIRFGYQGDILTALDSYITGQPSDLYIQALKKTVVKVISKRVFEEFIDSSETNLRLWQKVLMALIYQQMEREQDILISSPVERYQRVHQRSPRLFQEIPHKYIASYLRMTPETLSRIKKD
ncbi:MAG: Crp/Fnr family transcriptional regulator [Marinoscillum sp.]|uniref:Crp/Fnr family transcriptional regulator n=2 Tax=Marinoscillum sp. TaxID=2024838 RepID=UPI0032F1FEEE